MIARRTIISGSIGLLSLPSFTGNRNNIEIFLYNRRALLFRDHKRIFPLNERQRLPSDDVSFGEQTQRVAFLSVGKWRRYVLGRVSQKLRPTASAAAAAPLLHLTLVPPSSFRHLTRRRSPLGYRLSSRLAVGMFSLHIYHK